MDSNYRDNFPRKRTFEQVEQENEKLKEQNIRLKKKHRKLIEDIQDEILKEMLSGKPRFTGSTSIDVLKNFGFTIQATLTTREGEKIDLKTEL